MRLRLNASFSLLILSVVSTALTIQTPALAEGKISWSTAYSDGTEALSAGKLANAEEQLRKALQLVKSQSKDPADSEKCMLKLADTLALRAKTSEAQQLYLTLQTNLSKRYGSNSKQIAPVLIALGSIQESFGDHRTAMSYYSRALKINEATWGPYSPGIADNLRRLGRASFHAGQKEQGKQHYRRAMDIMNQDPSLSASKDLEVLTHEYNDLLIGTDNSKQQLINDFDKDILGNPKSAQKQNGSATANSSASSWQQEGLQKLSATKQHQANEDPEIILRGPMSQTDKALAPAFKTIDDSVFKQSRYDKGEDNYKRTIATDINALGPNHPAVANDMIALARLYISQQKYADAEPILMKALPIYEQAYGSNNVLTIKTRAMLAGVEFHLGNVDKAATMYKMALSNGQSVLGPNDLETANILNQLAYLYYHQGKLQEASTFYEWAVASTEGAVGEKDRLLAACLKDYAQVLRSLGKMGQAGELELRAGKILADAK